MISFVRRQAVLGVALSAILVLSIVASSLTADAAFSARVLVKGAKSNIVILVKNSGKSTESIYQFTVSFITGKPVTAIARGGWADDKSGSTVTFSTDSRPIGPGGSALFLIRVTDIAASAFEWSALDKEGNELQSGEVLKVKVREKKPTLPIKEEIVPEINIDQARVERGNQVVVTGKGFTPTSSVTLYLNNKQQLTTATVNSEGAFNAVVIIPKDILGGAHLIVAKDTGGKSSQIQVLVTISGGTTTGPTGPLILSIALDKSVYLPGDTMHITGTAVMERAVSLQVFDPRGNILCGANPPVDNATLTWEYFCNLPNDLAKGTYKVEAKQLSHKTSAIFTIAVSGTGAGGEGSVEGGESAGTLVISTDKPSYKSGETVKITLNGARSNSVVQIIVIGPAGPPLEAKMTSANEAGTATHEYTLVAAALGTYQAVGKQDKYVARVNFEVVAE